MSNILIDNFSVIILFFTVAVLYSSVGFGGGSSYIAILAFLGISFLEIKSTALLCNIVVVSSNVILYNQKKLLDLKKNLYLIALSVPLAFLGGFIKISENFFFVLLGVTLFFAAITMWISKKLTYRPKFNTQKNNIINPLIGGGIGLLSGMVGIGGGIFLSPTLHLTNWDIPKKIAATSSLFILVNSIAGFLGLISQPNIHINWSFTGVLLLTVFVGSIIGNNLSDKFLSPYRLKRATAILIAIVSIRILIKHLF